VKESVKNCALFLIRKKRIDVVQEQAKKNLEKLNLVPEGEVGTSVAGVEETWVHI